MTTMLALCLRIKSHQRREVDIEWAEAKNYWAITSVLSGQGGRDPVSIFDDCRRFAHPWMRPEILVRPGPCQQSDYAREAGPAKTRSRAMTR